MTYKYNRETALFYANKIYCMISLCFFLSFWFPFASSILCAQPNSSIMVKNWREDLRFMSEQMEKQHRNLFHTMSPKQFTEAVNKLNDRIPYLKRHQIITEMARITAMVRDGHTNIAPTRDPKIGFRTYPIKLYYFKDGLYVRSATREHADIVGLRVKIIGNSSVEEAYKAVREIIGRDNEMDVKFFAPHLLVMPEVLHALGLINDMEKAELTLEEDKKLKVVTLKPHGPAEMMPPDTDISWVSAEGWIDARENAQGPTPLWLKNPQDKYWYEYLPDSRTVYVQLNQVTNKKEETIESFSKRLFAFVKDNPVERFILDLRLNRGGDGTLNRPLIVGILKSDKIDQRGKLFTIIGRSTWSAAQFLVNSLEEYTNTIFVGEPTGGKINSYGDSRKIILPNSGITVRVSTLWWQEDERDNRQWTAPHIAADLSIEDYRNNIDPSMKKILNYVSKKSLTEVLMEAVSENNFKLAEEKYRQWKSDPDNAYLDAEPQLNILGYELMAKKQMDKAIEIFKLYVNAFPQSANAYDSLGEAYLNSGNKESAIHNYRKALELNPSMPSAIEALKKLIDK